MKINRLLKIIVILMNQQNITVKYLAEKFEVSRKTIYRDLETLITSGIPVCYGEDHKGIVSIMEGYSLKYAILPNKENGNDVVDLSGMDTEDMITQEEIESRKNDWQTFMTQKRFDFEEINKEILQSWNRSKKNGALLYHMDAGNLLTPERTKEYNVEYLEVYEEEGVRLFNQIVKKLGLNIVICNKNCILQHIYNLNEDFANFYPKLGYFIDASEYVLGTSANSVAIAEDRVVSVIGAEHYNQLLHDYSGVSAPFYQNGEVAGVVSTFFLHTSITNYTLNVIYGLARLYESLVIEKSGIIPEIAPEEEDKSTTEKCSFEKMIGRSQVWEDIIGVCKALATTDVPLVIKGEEGVGKRSLAKCIHYESSRKQGPCISFDCQSLPEELLKMTILGHQGNDRHKERRGIVESAIGGTIILSNVECLTLELQKKLYTHLKTGKFKRLSSNKMEDYDVRIIVCTTMKDLNTLYPPLRDKLETVQIKVAPLRERREDIRLLIRSYIDNLDSKKEFSSGLSAAIVKKLEKHEWPGNVRELHNEIAKLMVLEIDPEEFLKKL
jgi:transcriptional regulator with PAS, ATPase and Fis domain